jgi:hypothetical protein
LLVCNWPHSVGKNHFFVMMLFNRDSAIQSASRRFWTIYKSKNLVPCQPSGRRVIPSGCPTVQSIIRSDDENFPSGPSSCREASNCSSLNMSGCFSSTSRRLSIFDKLQGFFPKNMLWKDRCNRPENVDSRPDMLIHKASIAFKVQMSGRQSAWS